MPMMASATRQDECCTGRREDEGGRNISRAGFDILLMPFSMNTGRLMLRLWLALMVDFRLRCFTAGCSISLLPAASKPPPAAPRDE